MKKNKPSQQNSLDAFLSGKSYSTKKESSNNISKPEKKQKLETQPPIPIPEKITKKSQKRENPPEDDIVKPKEDTKEQMNENIIQKDKDKNTKEKGNSILFRDIVDVLLKVEQCKGENSKDQVKELLSNLFIKIINDYPQDLPKVYYFLSSKVGPEYISPEFGIGEGILEKIVGKVIGISDKQLKEKLIETGDLGIVASEGKKNVKTMDAFSNFFLGPTLIKLLKASIVFTFFLPSLATIPRSPVSINLSFSCLSDIPITFPTIFSRIPSPIPNSGEIYSGPTFELKK